MIETNIQFVLLLLFHSSVYELFVYHVNVIYRVYAFELQIGENHVCFLNVQYIQGTFRSTRRCIDLIMSVSVSLLKLALSTNQSASLSFILFATNFIQIFWIRNTI